MTAPRSRVVFCVVALVASASLAASAAGPSTVQMWARYWMIPPDVWQGSQVWETPEKAALDARHLHDLGIAFSGGGTRSATATLGQLRGLSENGWLKHVRYITAVSGGSWTSVPFVYSTSTPEALLGKTVPPEALTLAFLKTAPNKGTIALAIVKSGLYATGAAEAGKIVVRAELAKGKESRIPTAVQSLVARFVAGNTSQTYANMLAKIFINPFVDNGNARRYTWDAATFNAIKDTDNDAPLGVKDFVQTNPIARF